LPFGRFIPTPRVVVQAKFTSKQPSINNNPLKRIPGMFLIRRIYQCKNNFVNQNKGKINIEKANPASCPVRKIGDYKSHY